MRFILRFLKWVCDESVAQQQEKLASELHKIEGEYKFPICGCCPTCLEMGYAFGLMGKRHEELLREYYPIDGVYEFAPFSPPKGFMTIQPHKPLHENIIAFRHH